MRLARRRRSDGHAAGPPRRCQVAGLPRGLGSPTIRHARCV